jgi:type II secretory pathway pseudopilin PulG
MMKPLFTQKGYSLVEMVIYAALLTIISLVVVRTVLSFTQSYRRIAALRFAENSGISAMERMTREIRGATSVVSASSTLAASPGVLTLVAGSGSISTTTKFYTQSGTMKVDVNGAYSGPLSVSNASISSLTFTLISNSNTSAVKIDMSVQATSGPVTITKTYHSTVVLQGS